MNEITTKRSDFLREEYSRFRHSSGLEVYVFPKKLTTSYAILATSYGSIDSRFKLAGDRDFTEVPDGVAHFLEHKMFEQPSGEDAFTGFARLGANANAYTSNTVTAYLFSCTSHFDENLGLLLDFVTTPYFTPESVEKERGIIAQEIRMYEDHPGSRLMQLLLEGMYEKHSVRRNVAGTVESISHITPEILYECCRVFYNLSNMALIVCGDLTVEEVSAVCDRVLKPQPPVEIIRDKQVERPEAAKRRVECEMQVSKPLFAIGIKDTDIPSDGAGRMKKTAALSILNDLLFDKTGEFYNRLYEEGLISNQFDYGLEYYESFAFGLLCGDSSDPDRVYDRFIERIETAKREGFALEDFERIKRARYAATVKCFDSTEEIANSMLGYVFGGGDLLDYADTLAQVSYDDVTELLRTVFRPEYCTLAVVDPIKD